MLLFKYFLVSQHNLSLLINNEKILQEKAVFLAVLSRDFSQLNVIILSQKIVR